MAFPVALALTLLIEVPLVVVLTRSTTPAGDCTRVAAVANLVSHPLLWFVLQPSIGLIAAELVVTAGEAAAYTRFLRLPARDAALVSIIANGTSLAFGVTFSLL